jgi:hypothetical protein
VVLPEMNIKSSEGFKMQIMYSEILCVPNCGTPAAPCLIGCGLFRYSGVGLSIEEIL